MNFRGLFRVAAVCAIGYVAVSLASYIATLSASGFLIASSKLPSAEQLYASLQLKGNHISLRLDLLSYFLLIPSLVGIYAYLRVRRPGLGLSIRTGSLRRSLCFDCFFVQTALYSAAMTLAEGPLTDSLKERQSAMSLLAFSFMIPALWSAAVFNLLWGLALRTQKGLARMSGNFLLAQVIGFLIAGAGFNTGQDVVGNVGILINKVALAASFASVGALLRKASKEEPQPKTDVQEQPLAAGASA